MTDQTTKKRKIAGVMDAMTEVGLSEGYKLALEEEETLQGNGNTNHVLPVWRWCITAQSISTGKSIRNQLNTEF